MTDQIRHIRVNDATLGYAVHGAGPGKPPLVFVHGYAMRATGTPYLALLDLLARDYAVHALDLRGHGASADALAGWTHEALADDVAAFAGALGLSHPVYVGHSFGAVIGLFAELRHPGTFSALCLLSPGPADHRRDPPDALAFMIEHGRDRGKLSGGFGRMFTRPPGALLDATLDAAVLLDPKVHLAQQALNPRFSIDDRLGDVAQPVLLVVGESDSVIAPGTQHDMARKLPCAKEVVFTAQGHMLPNESPAVAAREILGFLRHDQSIVARGGGG